MNGVTVDVKVEYKISINGYKSEELPDIVRQQIAKYALAYWLAFMGRDYKTVSIILTPDLGIEEDYGVSGGSFSNTPDCLDVRKPIKPSQLGYNNEDYPNGFLPCYDVYIEDFGIDGGPDL